MLDNSLTTSRFLSFAAMCLHMHGAVRRYTPMHGAGFQGRKEVAEVLFKHGVPLNDIHEKDKKGPVQRACWGSEPRHLETAKWMLENGAELMGTELEETRTQEMTEFLRSWLSKEGKGKKKDTKKQKKEKNQKQEL